MDKEKDFTYVEEIGPNDSIQCPKCAKEIKAAMDLDWDYIDGESHIVKCPCGNELELVCDRHIIIQVHTLEE